MANPKGMATGPTVPEIIQLVNARDQATNPYTFQSAQRRLQALSNQSPAIGAKVAVVELGVRSPITLVISLVAVATAAYGLIKSLLGWLL